MRPFLPKRFEFVAFGFLVSGLMSFLVSGMATAIGTGFHAGFFLRWFAAWIPAWMIAFPTILVVAPIVRRALARIVIDD